MNEDLWVIISYLVSYGRQGEVNGGVCDTMRRFYLLRNFSCCSPASETKLREVHCAWWRSQRLCLHHLRPSASVPIPHRSILMPTCIL